MTIRAIYFDMDGTVADLYNSKDWLPRIRAELSDVYNDLLPLCDMIKLSNLCGSLQGTGVKIGIISWASKDSSNSYYHQVAKEKREWTKKYMPYVNEMHVQHYGTPKNKSLRHSIKNCVLVDDNELVGRQWEKSGGIWIDGKKDIINEIKKLIF